MIALAEVLREMYLEQQRQSLEMTPDHNSILTAKGKLLVQ
jgi:hypothetical protein